MEKLKNAKANQIPLLEKGSSVDLSVLEIPVVGEDGRWKEKSRGKDDEADHRSTGQKFKRSKEKETDHSPDVNTIRNTPKKVRYHSTSSQKDGFAENSPVNNSISSAEKRSITREVRHDSVSNNKDDVDSESKRALMIPLSSNENITRFLPFSATTTKSPGFVIEMDEFKKYSKEALKTYPQNPHYGPLLIYPEPFRKYMAYSLMIGFVELVRDVKNLSSNASDGEYDEMFKTVDYLEEHGFSVEQIRDRLTKLREMRGAMTS